MRSKAFLRADLTTIWYKKWAALLNQTESGRGNFALEANKFWQNAIMAQALYERGVVEENKRGLGFGVGMERLPALFASYGVQVMATDQDFTTIKASSWNNGQLAQGSQSLNTDNICPPDVFAKNVAYRSVDMNKIPKDFNGKFDFIWSNCALGHLGSIEKSKEFIMNSLNCLAPGGWAVHTTEANILSDTDTLDNSDTVFWRQRDLYDLFKKLSKQGYIVSALNFNLGSSQADKRFTLSPKWGSEHSKILFNGYMATHIVLIIKKPTETNFVSQQLQVFKHFIFYRLNLLNIKLYLKRNKKLSAVLAMNEAASKMEAVDTNVTPISKPITVKLKKNETKIIRIEYKNNSPAALFASSGHFAGTNPLALATAEPINRASKFRSENWYGDNRPSFNLYAASKKGNKAQPIEFVEPEQSFLVEFSISANKQKPGSYKEQFCLVKEGDNAIPSTEVTLEIEVI